MNFNSITGEFSYRTDGLDATNQPQNLLDISENRNMIYKLIKTLLIILWVYIQNRFERNPYIIWYCIVI